MKIYPPQNHQNNVRKRRERFIFAVTKVVQIMLLREEFVSNMEPKLRYVYAAIKDVPIKLSREEFVGNMGQNNVLRRRKGRLVAMKAVRAMHRREECVTNMAQNTLADTKDVPIRQGMEEF